MRYRRLGSSDLSVSEISFGTWLSYGEGETRARHIACIRRALELGVNLFDTANVYGWGEAERLLAEALAGVPRDRYLLATKLWGPMNDTDKGLSRRQVFKQIDGSLLPASRQCPSCSCSIRFRWPPVVAGFCWGRWRAGPSRVR